MSELPSTVLECSQKQSNSGTVPVSLAVFIILGGVVMLVPLPLFRKDPVNSSAMFSMSLDAICNGDRYLVQLTH